MTSKESLEQLLYYATLDDSGFEPYMNDYASKIQKDLEVLEILKNESDYKKIIEKDGIATFHLDMVLTQDTILKVKEWLENEK